MKKKTLVKFKYILFINILDFSFFIYAKKTRKKRLKSGREDCIYPTTIIIENQRCIFMEAIYI